MHHGSEVASMVQTKKEGSVSTKVCVVPGSDVTQGSLMSVTFYGGPVALREVRAQVGSPQNLLISGLQGLKW